MTEVPQSIVTLLDSIKTQIELITALSSGGFVVIIYTWARVLGILDDANLRNFKKPLFLLIPLAGFLISIILSYITSSLTTGYFTEIAQGRSADGTSIDSAWLHYSDDYYAIFESILGVQLLASVVGAVLLAGWYTGNIIVREKTYETLSNSDGESRLNRPAGHGRAGTGN